MLVVLSLAAVTALGLVILWRNQIRELFLPGLVGAVLTIIGAIALIVCTIMVPVRQAHQGASIEEYRELQRAVAGAPRGAEMEDVYGQVVSMNRYIARARYWNDSWWFGWYWNDEFAALPPIEIPARRG